MANESNLSFMAYERTSREPEKPQPGDRVWHPEYGAGEVRQHPDDPGERYADDPRHYGVYVWFEDTAETTLRRVRDWKALEIA